MDPNPEPESPMSRRKLTLVVLTLASLAAACGTSPTAPKHDAPIVVSGSGG
jgi:hypothetical protein